MTLNDKLSNLENILKTYGKITVALSGGVDSAFLLAFASKVMGRENVFAITAKGPHLASDEVKYAEKLCAALEIKQTIAIMDHIMPVLAPNPKDRCYHCKKSMFTILKALSTSLAAGGTVLVDGTNLDDMNDYRPGHKALDELKIASPLKDACLTKNEIREALHQTAQANPDLEEAFFLDDGMAIWEKPAFACLASRIPYGESITEKKMQEIYEAEKFLQTLGFAQVRVRHHGDIARIEVLPEDRKKLLSGVMDKINDYLKGLGFKYVTLDLEGYKMGGGFHVR